VYVRIKKIENFATKLTNFQTMQFEFICLLEQYNWDFQSENFKSEIINGSKITFCLAAHEIMVKKENILDFS